jgi:hypothetical protein
MGLGPQQNRKNNEMQVVDGCVSWFARRAGPRIDVDWKFCTPSVLKYKMF